MLYYTQTIPGLGQLAWQEIEFQLPHGKNTPPPKLVALRPIPGRDDVVMFDYAGSPVSILKLRVSEDVFAVAARAFKVARNERGLGQMHAAVSKSTNVNAALQAWKQATHSRKQPNTYRVIARTVGQQTFTRREMGRAVGDAVRSNWPGRWREVKEDADVEVWATLAEGELLCGVRLSGPEMRQRGKQHHLPASLRPALAAAMVMLSDPAPSDVFLDPMAGAGTLLAERAAAGEFDEMHGGDNSAQAVRAMRENLRGVGGNIDIHRWDARSLPLEDRSVDKVAVNLPFGKQVDAGVDLDDLYRRVLAELQRVLEPGGRAVLLVGNVNQFNSARNTAARKLRSGKHHKVIVLGTNATILEVSRQ